MINSKITTPTTMNNGTSEVESGQSVTMFSRASFAEFFPFDLPKLAYVDTDISYYSDKDMGDEKKKNKTF